ncbi:MAG: SDR family oxidoreductase [Parasporobacterium sp.]|nr:SDR family oxidoreductase [Parasporobacterium sp.]
MAYKVETIEELRSFKSMFSLEGKVALVTGAGGGIGRSTAAGFAELGAKVVLMDIPKAEEKLKANCEAISKKYGAETMYVLGDVSDPDSVNAFIQEAVDRFGTIDVVHNNAGVGLQPDTPTQPYEQWAKEIGINLTGSFLVARGCAEVMKAHGHGGSIISTASMSGVIINAGVAYSSSKAGVMHMSNCLAIDYADCGIRFNSVCYGYVLSGLHESFGASDLNAVYDNFTANTPLGRIASLEEAVGIVLYLATDLSSYQTASASIVDGGVCVNKRNKSRAQFVPEKK